MSILIAALLFLLLPLGSYLLFGWAILYHILRFGFHSSINRRIAIIFTFTLFALGIFVLANFALVDWGSVDINDFLAKSNLNMLI
jgi:hypothetical protein